MCFQIIWATWSRYHKFYNEKMEDWNLYACEDNGERTGCRLLQQKLQNFSFLAESYDIVIKFCAELTDKLKLYCCFGAFCEIIKHLWQSWLVAVVV